VRAGPAAQLTARRGGDGAPVGGQRWPPTGCCSRALLAPLGGGWRLEGRESPCTTTGRLGRSVRDARGGHGSGAASPGRPRDRASPDCGGAPGRSEPWGPGCFCATGAVPSVTATVAGCWNSSTSIGLKREPHMVTIRSSLHLRSVKPIGEDDSFKHIGLWVQGAHSSYFELLVAICSRFR